MATTPSSAAVTSDTDSWSANIYSTDANLYGTGSASNYTTGNTIDLGSPWNNYENSEILSPSLS